MAKILPLNPEHILNINKPPGWTSFQLVRTIRDHFHIQKIGHAGTLDPFATGVMLVMTGRATKQFDRLMLLEKAYSAEIEFGIETDSFDVDGKITARCSSIPPIDRTTILDLLKKFQGEIEQVPPVFSAIKYRGKPLYKYARKGIPVQPKARRVTIKSIELIEFNWPLVTVDIVCSKGTYIRSLARDLGRELKTGAYLKSLARTRIGEYSIDNSYEVSEILEKGEAVFRNESC